MVRWRAVSIVVLCSWATLSGCGDSGSDEPFQDVAAPGPMGGSSGSGGGGSGTGAVGGASGGNAPATCTGTLEDLQARIFDTSCAVPSCHAGDVVAAGLDLTAASAAESLGAPAALCDGWQRVVPGQPEQSLLYVKVAGTVPDGCGERMPIGGMLDADDSACIRAWIEALSPGDLPGPGGCQTCGTTGCVDLQSDPAHCGGCDVACAASEVCNAGVCDAGGCGALTQCAQACVDTDTSQLHCGGCDNPCAADQSCIGGTCTCLDGRPVCDGACVDTDFDPNHCGGCGMACDPGESCTAGACGCGTATAAFAADVQPILTTRCATAGCHGGPKPQASLSLASGAAYGALVDVASGQCGDGRLRVAPGDPANSYLMDKLLGIDLCFGTQMPKSGMSLPADELSAISAWICAGAPND